MSGRLASREVLFRVGATVITAGVGIGLSRSVAVPPENGNCMMGRTCRNNGDLSGVDWPLVAYVNGCKLYPTYTEDGLRALNGRRTEQGLGVLSVGSGLGLDVKPGESGYVDSGLPVAECEAPEVVGYRFVGWIGSEFGDVTPLYEKVNP